MIKSNKVIEKMKEISSDPLVLNNVLSKNDIYELKNFRTFLKNSDPTLIRSRKIEGKRSNELTIIPYEYFEKINLIIQDKINLLPFKYESMNFYTIQNPYHIHSDTGKNNRISYKIILIPLEIDPKKDAKTIIFDQRCYFSSEYVFPHFDNDPKYEPFYNIPIRNPSFFEGWSIENKITEEQAKSFWGEKWEFWLRQYEGFSVKFEYNWNIGDILIFDRSSLHASSLLQENNIDYKSGILIQTFIE